MLINIIYVQYKTKKGKDKIVKYLGRDDLNPENESFHRTTIKFETQISRTVYWRFLAFTLLSLPSKWDTMAQIFCSTRRLVDDFVLDV